MVATRHSSAHHGALCPQVSGWDELRSGRWRLIRLVSPVYLGRARNEAARHARGESLLVSPLYLYLPYLPCISEEPAVSPSLYLPGISPYLPCISEEPAVSPSPSSFSRTTTASDGL